MTYENMKEHFCGILGVFGLNATGEPSLALNELWNGNQILGENTLETNRLKKRSTLKKKVGDIGCFFLAFCCKI